MRASGFGPGHHDLRRISAIRQNHNPLKSLTSFWNGHLEIEARGELDLAEHMQAILRSMMLKG
ncbi:hypothetical protein D3227_39265 [Mesorhizobium waimense]|uniref:Uncharacterized protein n=1 Tax=Mesorhizobium waimense TaxID=1300307 RepID=A0A3A5JQ89_9HYPH|nr:hypothetical protein D3227_39265 [Mesorhizobium waimense]